MRTPPEDSYHGAYCIFLLQGIGQLFPWNVFINAQTYHSQRFCGSVFEASFEDSFAFAYNLAAIVGLLITLRFQEHRKLRGRIMGSLAVAVLTFVGCGVLVMIEQASAGLLFFSTLALIVTSGLAIAVLQGSLFSMASAFPPRYTQAMMAGQGLAGLGVSLAGLFTTLAGPDDRSCISGLDHPTNASRRRADLFTDHHLVQALEAPLESSCVTYTRDWSTVVYFSIAVVVLVGCMLSYPVLERLPLTTFYTSAVSNGVEQVEVQNASEDDIDGGNSGDSGGGGWLAGRRATVAPSVSPRSSMYRRLVEPPPVPLFPIGKPLSDSRVCDKEEEGRRREDVVVYNEHVTTTLNGFRAKLAPVSRYAFAVFFAFTVTLSVFPGATSEIESSRRCQPGRPRFFAGDVFILFSFVSFNAFDLLGRVAAGASVVLPKAWLPAASLSRIVFIPLLLSCRSQHSRFRYWLSADAFPLSIMPAFAFTNGYISSLSMMAGSQSGAWAGTAMVLCLSAGLMAGSSLSFLVLFARTKS